MNKLMLLEAKKYPIQTKIVAVLIANIVIFILSAAITGIVTLFSKYMDLGILISFQMDTLTIAKLLVRAFLIVLQAILIAQIIIEEYRNKTITLLFTYPVTRRDVIMAKITYIVLQLLAFHFVSLLFQQIAVFALGQVIPPLQSGFEPLWSQGIITLSCIALGFFPMLIGCMHNSSIATIVSSLVIACSVSSSQGMSAGLMAVPFIALFLGSLGVFSAALAVKKILNNDVMV